MKLFKGNTDLYLNNTIIENLFINEYIIPAKGTFVKVYLFAKMYLDGGWEISNETLAKYMNISLNDVLNAWEYWESKNVIKKHYTGPNPNEFDLEFVCLKQLMYKGNTEAGTEAYASPVKDLNAVVFSDELILLLKSIENLTGRTLNMKEIRDVKLWSEDWGMSDTIIIKAYNTCINDRKKRPEHSYISTIIRSWYEKGLFTEETLNEYLSEHDKKNYTYKRIFKALGFIGRYPTEEEKRIMDIWIDEYMLDITTILEACKKTAGIGNPNINYIHTILKDWKNNHKVTSGGKKMPTAAEIDQIYRKIRMENKNIFDKRTSEIFGLIPRIKEIQSELKELNPKRVKLIISGKKDSSTYNTIEKEIKNLKKEKDSLLKNAGYPEDYLNPVYSCSKCKDTGYLNNGEKCVCLIQHLQNM